MRKTSPYIFLFFVIAFFRSPAAFSAGVIEKQLEEIGKIPNEEVIVVQRKYTRKGWRSEITPITFGGAPFGTIYRTLISGANYNLHFTDLFSWEAVNFLYFKNFFSSFTDDINSNKNTSINPTQNDIKPDYQKLLYLLTSGFQMTPFYGKFSTFSRWIAYIEPYFSLGAGIAKTEVDQYFVFYPGIGLRVFFREWFSMRIDFRDYIYTEKFKDSSLLAVTSTRNAFAVTAGFSLWLPKM